ncbi:galactokinase [Neodiprion lecontei]|uniref:Galactokinase n=1 Tax=Neodiprion lecontei TaxID=441921 RepID=A0A6J0B8R7_NEOLC|nr:galactokinase [Neodiprion lecontei]XP_015511365.1 galactokinase [Neodiprion lecontei]XP_046587710.1 galactokinase [Neodiprion lecontei]XP_046587711.1 galactokinase [Neodiprion lecontei]
MATVIPDKNDLRVKALQAFAKEFGEDATFCACAPGRVNLIGEHTDYNEGFVLPMALPMVTVIAARPNQSHRCVVITMSGSIGHVDRAEFDISNRDEMKSGEPKWANYVKGPIANFTCNVPGFDALIISSVPVGAGLSSSAALEVATYTLLEALSGCRTIELNIKAVACQQAEHEFAGVPCGIMDQFISVMGKEGHALLLDCRNLSTKHIPMVQEDCVFLITNSNAPHKLSSSQYTERREACYVAARRLNLKSLREATIADLEILKAQNVCEMLIKRARHVITEISRTVAAAQALEEGSFVKFGQLMNESHDSLQKDYEVSSQELDSLVSAAREIRGVLGSRLTGAGFGGCTVTLVKKDSVDELIKNIKQKYKGNPDFYVAIPDGGAREMGINYCKCTDELH